jgi:hypothetical protein
MQQFVVRSDIFGHKQLVVRWSCVRAASAPIVVFCEDHAFPDPTWAEALIVAHRRPYAAVGPVVRNANPSTVISGADCLIGYGPWLEISQPCEPEHLPHATFSVIVPTYERPELLAACLSALAGQVYPHEQYEVIVVDDGSAFDVDDVRARLEARFTNRLSPPGSRGAALLFDARASVVNSPPITPRKYRVNK